MSNLNQATCIFLVCCSIVAYIRRDDLLATLKKNSSPIDWCEENYEVNPGIAEFWNTVSAVLQLVPAFLGWLIYRNTKLAKHEPNIFIMFTLIAVIGTGSIYFHGTLSAAG